MPDLTNGQLFNLVSGNEVTGESTFDIWKSLDGNENKTQADFIEYMKLGASGLEIDDELSESSTNPIQNKVVSEKFSQFQETVDDALTLKADNISHEETVELLTETDFISPLTNSDGDVYTNAKGDVYVL